MNDKVYHPLFSSFLLLLFFFFSGSRYLHTPHTQQPTNDDVDETFIDISPSTTLCMAHALKKKKKKREKDSRMSDSKKKKNFDTHSLYARIVLPTAIKKKKKKNYQCIASLTEKKLEKSNS